MNAGSPADHEAAIQGALALLCADIPCSNGCGCEGYDYCAQDEGRKKAIPSLAALVGLLQQAERLAEQAGRDEGEAWAQWNEMADLKGDAEARAEQAGQERDEAQKDAILGRYRYEAAEARVGVLEAALRGLESSILAYFSDDVELPEPVMYDEVDASLRSARAALAAAAAPPSETP